MSKAKGIAMSLFRVYLDKPGGGWCEIAKAKTLQQAKKIANKKHATEPPCDGGYLLESVDSVGNGEMRQMNYDIVPRLNARAVTLAAEDSLSAYTQEYTESLLREAAEEITRLRDGPNHRFVVASAEIERLREEAMQLQLTDVEVWALKEAAHACGSCNGFNNNPEVPALHKGDEVAAALNSILERLTLKGIMKKLFDYDYVEAGK